jgi:hypothetical protein
VLLVLPSYEEEKKLKLGRDATYASYEKRIAVKTEKIYYVSHVFKNNCEPMQVAARDTKESGIRRE